jgi:hypothetical protein
MDFSGLPPDYFITSLQFTKKVHTEVYPSIDPTTPALSQAGKVVIITGASKGLGRTVCPLMPHNPRLLTVSILPRLYPK